MMLMLQKIWTTVLLVHKRVDDLDKRLQVPNKNMRRGSSPLFFDVFLSHVRFPFMDASNVFDRVFH